MRSQISQQVRIQRSVVQFEYPSCSKEMKCLSALILAISLGVALSNPALKPLESLNNIDSAALETSKPHSEHDSDINELINELITLLVKTMNCPGAAGERKYVEGNRKSCYQMFYFLNISENKDVGEGKLIIT